MESSTIAEAQFLNMLKNRVREITRLLDLLGELHAHGLLPEEVQSQQDTSHLREKRKTR